VYGDLVSDVTRVNTKFWGNLFIYYRYKHKVGFKETWWSHMFIYDNKLQLS